MPVLLVGNLVFGDSIMNKWSCLEILKKSLKSKAEKIGILVKFRFYIDNDIISDIAKEWTSYKCTKKSPDWKVIKLVWHEVGIQNHEIFNKAQLCQVFQEEW